jgi:16S rRNA (cytosine1402-N4)-methyltransferase
MDARQTLTAERVVNKWTKDELTRMIRDYAEEAPRAARRYAEAIAGARPLHTTEELANAIKNAYVGKWSRIHPATRTFQAIRIVVNDELGQIERTLPELPRLLNPGGRVAVISFHSLEDRLVKRYFAEQTQSGYEAELKVLTKHPVLGETEDVHNPRSRSAKLRVAVKK